jgi:iron complex outermembrane receptor protein
MEKRCRPADSAAGARHHDCPGRRVLPQAVKALIQLAMLMAVALPARPQQKTEDLTNKSLEDLMNMEVTSVSRKEQKISQVAAAIFVITQEDIVQSGATNIPDLLRMVPGLDVARINGSTWAVSARGFNDQFADKLLVLIDGRTVYSPLFSGVFWDSQNVPLDEIERIEVIRGPGATIWGANAVNGVINITTKKAADTQGGLVTGGGGTLEHGMGTLRYGGKVGNHTSYRVFSSFIGQDHLPGLSGQNGEDDGRAYRGGFRVDVNPTAKDSFTLEGDAEVGNEGERVASIASISPPVNQLQNLRQDFSGWDVVGRWNHTASPRSETSLQFYLDRASRYDPTAGEGDLTFDLDFEQHAAWGNRQDFVWGLGYRVTSDHTRSTLRSSFVPTNETAHLFTSFVQDEIALRPDRISLTLGVKTEHNHFSGFNFQPSARITWIVNEHSMFWAAFSRAVRTPSRAIETFRLNSEVLPGPGGLPVLVSEFGNPEQQNEILEATEVGYRVQQASNLSLDLTAFYNHYIQIQSIEVADLFLEADPPPLHLVFPLHLSNMLHGETHGIEAAVKWKVSSRWTLSPGYSFLAMHLHRNPASNDPSSVASDEGSSPTHEAQLRSHVQLPAHWQWDTSVYFVDRLPFQGVPSYTRLDTELIWKAREHLSISLIGQNLLKDHHAEFNALDQVVLSSLVKRSAYAMFTWKF